MTSPSDGPQPEPNDGRQPEAARAADAADAQAPADAGPEQPVLPEQSREDTDAAWGEYRERDDDRLYQDRPPHWDDF